MRATAITGGSRLSIRGRGGSRSTILRGGSRPCALDIRARGTRSAAGAIVIVLILRSSRTGGAHRHKFLAAGGTGILVQLDFLDALLLVRQVGDHAILVINVRTGFGFAPDHHVSGFNVLETNDAVSADQIRGSRFFI